MRRRHFEVTQRSAAAPAAVFALLVDGGSWPRWSPIEAFELERTSGARGLAEHSEHSA